MHLLFNVGFPGKRDWTDDVIREDSTLDAARGRRVAAVGIALAAALVLAAASSAAAKPEPVGGGTTTLRITGTVDDYLSDNDTKVKAVDPAKDRKSGLAFPIRRGELDSKKPRGELKHGGGVELKGPGDEVELTKLTARFGKSSKLKARVNKENTALFDLDTDNAKVKQSQGTIAVTRVKAVLTSKGAALIEDVTEMEVDDPEAVFGKLKVAATPGDLNLEGGEAELVLDNAFPGGGIAASAIEPATQGTRRVGFPIVGGKVSPDGDSGVVRLDGGLRLSRQGTRLDLTKPRIDLGKGQVSIKVAGIRTAIASFDADSATTSLKGSKVTITAIEAALTSDGATAINEALGSSAFSRGEALGRFEVQGTTTAG